MNIQRPLILTRIPFIPRVLVVDDDAAVRSFAARVFEGAGYDVACAVDGPDALRVIAQHRVFDLFVIDLTMPEMAGDELARQLRAQNPDVKVLYFTGYADALFGDKGTLWQHEAFIEKPASVRGLLEAASLLLFGHTHGLQQ